MNSGKGGALSARKREAAHPCANVWRTSDEWVRSVGDGDGAATVAYYYFGSAEVPHPLDTCVHKPCPCLPCTLLQAAHIRHSICGDAFSAFTLLSVLRLPTRPDFRGNNRVQESGSAISSSRRMFVCFALPSLHLPTHRHINRARRRKRLWSHEHHGIGGASASRETCQRITKPCIL